MTTNQWPARAIEAHGGQQRWQNLTRITARARIGGGLWGRKGKAGILDESRVTIQTRAQHTEYAPFREPTWHSVWEPGSASIVADDGKVVEQWPTSAADFASHEMATSWDDKHLIYFSGYAMWGYLAAPFWLAWPGVTVEELSPWDEDGESWTRLNVTAPEHLVVHDRSQVFYFDRHGLLRRLDYRARVTGAPLSAHYVDHYGEFAGLMIPTQRHAYGCGEDGRPLRDKVGVSIALSDIEPS